MTPQSSTRTISIAILLAAFVVAGSVWTRPAMGTKTVATAQGDIGLVDIYHLVDILIMSDEASQERTDFETKSSQAITALEQQLIGIQTQMSQITQDDPQSGQLYNQYQQVTQQIQQTTNQINAGYQQLLAMQIADAYKTIHAATNEISAQEGYTFVLATRRGADLVQTTTLTGVTQEILARPLITPPEAVDLTESIRLHLGLPTMEEITAKIQAEQAAADAAAQAAQEPTPEPAQESTDNLPTPATEITDE